MHSKSILPRWLGQRKNPPCCNSNVVVGAKGNSGRGARKQMFRKCLKYTFYLFVIILLFSPRSKKTYMKKLM